MPAVQGRSYVEVECQTLLHFVKFPPAAIMRLFGDSACLISSDIRLLYLGVS